MLGDGAVLCAIANLEKTIVMAIDMTATAVFLILILILFFELSVLEEKTY